MSAAAPNAPVPRSASRSLAMMVHLSTCVGFFLSIPTAAGIVGPAVVWVAAHRRDDFLTHHAREALNFHLSVLVYALALVTLPTPATVMAVVVVAWLAVVIMVAGLAYEGRPARYPGALPILRRPRRVSRG
ncbi:MAG TPA: DUF4870 domain-containing protein [Euzebyales bacterium]|nr:DUF4870 domain-containing protein [Euzebyales bacterium]